MISNYSYVIPKSIEVEKNYNLDNGSKVVDLPAKSLFKVFFITGCFLTGPPLKMSLDWPPRKMPRLAPPKFS